MQAKKISVVMPVFNARSYLAEAITSVLEQTFVDFEFIIIDDCSTDGSSEIISKFATVDKRIRTIRNKINGGAKGFAKNLNLGINLAECDYIARFDADDVCYKDRLQTQFEYLESNKHVELVGCSVDIINEDSKVQYSVYPAADPANILLKRNEIFHPTIMFRKGVNLYREKMLYCEDYDLYLRFLSEKKEMRNLPEVLLKYRVLTGSISRSNVYTQHIFSLKAKEFYLQRLEGCLDSYNNFDPLIFESSIDLNTKEALGFLIHSNLYSSDFKSAKKNAIKYTLKYGLNFYFIFVIIVSLFPKRFVLQLKSFFKKLPSVNFKALITKN